MNQSEIEYMRGRIDSLQIALAILIVSKLDESDLQNLKKFLGVIQETEPTVDTRGPDYKRGAEHTMRGILDTIETLKNQPEKEYA